MIESILTGGLISGEGEPTVYVTGTMTVDIENDDVIGDVSQETLTADVTEPRVTGSVSEDDVVCEITEDESVG